MTEEKKKKFKERMKIRYHLKIFNDETFQETWFVKFSRLKVYIIIISLSIFLITLIFSLIAYTPVRELIPGYPNKFVRKSLLENEVRFDSLEHALHMKDRFILSFQNILEGKEPLDFSDIGDDSSISATDPGVARSSGDSIIRAMVEQEQSYNLTLFDEVDYNPSLREIYFYCPMHGILSGKYNLEANHFGVDVLAEKNEVVYATLSGTVINASWDVESGYMIQIQHDNNLISIYKHNSDIMKVQGEIVKAGEAIAIIGNSGELTTGPHLHFELWYNGKAINPEEYIVF